MTLAHWAGKRRATRKYRKACWYAFITAKPKGWKPGPVVLDMEYRCPRGSVGLVVYDRANAIAAVKPMPDALQDAGIIDTDSHKNLDWGRVTLITQAAAMKGKTPGVTVTVRKL